MLKDICEKATELILEHFVFRSVAYFDHSGVARIGFGHFGSDVQKKDVGRTVITEERAEQFLQSDISTVAFFIRNCVLVPLTDNQYAALVSLVFDIGYDRFRLSKLFLSLNQKEYRRSALQFSKLTIIGPHCDDYFEILQRREAEKELFLTPDESQYFPSGVEPLVED